MIGDIVAGSVYTCSVYLIKNYISPYDLTWVDLIYLWYTYIILPFNILVLLSVLTNKYTEVSMPLFYSSRYLDYISTMQLLRHQKYEYLNLDVFHHATVPMLISLGWEDKYALRFFIFLIGIAASVYTSQNSSKNLIDSSTFLQSLSVVQWTQYIVVTVHTVRTSSKFKRVLFLAYSVLFTVLIIQFFYYYN